MEQRIANMEIKLAEQGSDIKHIKDRLDNGISQTVTKIYDKLNTMVPSVQDNSYWVGAIKKAFVWTSTVGVIGGIVSVFFFAIKNGMK